MHNNTEDNTTKTSSVHFSSKAGDWQTPDHVLDLAGQVLSRIDLDPCSDGHNVPAITHFTQADNGLSRSWHGNVYLNPPYGRQIGLWTTKLVEEYQCDHVSAAIALVPARTDTQWWRVLEDYIVCLVRGRLRFKGAAAGAPFPSAIFYLGPYVGRFRNHFSRIGTVWTRVATGPTHSLRAQNPVTKALPRGRHQ